MIYCDHDSCDYGFFDRDYKYEICVKELDNDTANNSCDTYTMKEIQGLDKNLPWELYGFLRSSSTPFDTSDPHLKRMHLILGEDGSHTINISNKDYHKEHAYSLRFDSFKTNDTDSSFDKKNRTIKMHASSEDGSREVEITIQKSERGFWG